jgi:hypothetical protein
MMNEPLSEEEYRALLEYGALNEDADQQMQQQRKLAEMLRNRPGPQMRQAGGLAVAPNWVEALGSIASAGVGHMKDKKADILGSQISLRKQQQNEMIMRGLLGRGGRPVNTYNPDSDINAY